MSLQLSVSARNARLDAIETAVGTSAVMKIWSGSPPANCAAADSGTLIASLSAPSNRATLRDSRRIGGSVLRRAA